jgi:hypothetical protein
VGGDPDQDEDGGQPAERTTRAKRGEQAGRDRDQQPEESAADHERERDRRRADEELVHLLSTRDPRVPERALCDDPAEELEVLLVERPVDLHGRAHVDVGAAAAEARLVVLRRDDEEDDERDHRDGQEHHDHPGGASQEKRGHGEPLARYAGRR